MKKKSFVNLKQKMPFDSILLLPKEYSNRVSKLKGKSKKFHPKFNPMTMPQEKKMVVLFKVINFLKLRKGRIAQTRKAHFNILKVMRAKKIILVKLKLHKNCNMNQSLLNQISKKKLIRIKIPIPKNHPVKTIRIK